MRLSLGPLTRATLMVRGAKLVVAVVIVVPVLHHGYPCRRGAALSRGCSRPGNLHHLEVRLGGSAVGAAPVVGDVVPAGAGRDAVFGPAFGLVVLESTLHADEQLEIVRARRLLAQALIITHRSTPI